MIALHRTIRILRYVKETLVLVLQALFPIPTHYDPARRQTRPQKGMPTSPPSWNTAVLTVMVPAPGRTARGHAGVGTSRPSEGWFGVGAGALSAAWCSLPLSEA